MWEKLLNQKEKKVKNKWINNNKKINLDFNKKLVRFIMHLKNTSTTQQTVKKHKHTQNKTMGYATPVMGYYPRNGEMGDIYSRSDM